MQEFLPLIIFALLAAFSAWLKRHREGEGIDRQAPPPGTAPPSRPPIDLEEQMRRLLGGEPRPEPKAPPVITPPPLVSERPTVTVPRPAPVRRPAARPEGPISSELLARAQQAFEKGSSVDERMRQRLKSVSAEWGRKRKRDWKRRGKSEAERAVALIRDPGAIRSAVLASIILGPPKALESGDSGREPQLR